MKIQLVSLSTYQELFASEIHLVGNETMYPDEFAAPFIRTFWDGREQNYYFRMRNTREFLLQPKYTFSGYEDLGGPSIIVSDEIFRQYGAECEMDIVYQLPTVDILSLTRLEGDFPQDCTIDVLLTRYLESCNIVNLLQEFTLHFTGNAPMANYITFQISHLTFTENGVEDQMTEELNVQLQSQLHPLGVEAKVASYCFCGTAGVVANNEVKIDFVERKLEVRKLQKSMGAPLVEKHVFHEKGLVLTGEQLTKEEVRLRRLTRLTRSD